MALFQPNFTHTHVLNNYTHVDHFWCLISKYTEYMAQIPLGSLRLDSTRLDMFDVSSPYILAVSSLSNSTARLAGHVKLDWLDLLDTLVWTSSTCRTCRVVSSQDVTIQVEFGLMITFCRGDPPGRRTTRPTRQMSVRRCITNIYTPLRGHRRSQCPA